MQSNSSENCIQHYNVEILNLFDPDFQLINTKPVIKSKLKELISELKIFRKILVRNKSSENNSLRPEEKK